MPPRAAARRLVRLAAAGRFFRPRRPAGICRLFPGTLRPPSRAVRPIPPVLRAPWTAAARPTSPAPTVLDAFSCSVPSFFPWLSRSARPRMPVPPWLTRSRASSRAEFRRTATIWLLPLFCSRVAVPIMAAQASTSSTVRLISLSASLDRACSARRPSPRSRSSFPYA